MQAPRACAGCGGIDFWHISQVVERDVGLTPMGVWLDGSGRPGGSFELLVCAGCGLGEWWVSDVEALKAHEWAPKERLSSAQPCSRCSSRSALYLPMFDQVTGMGP